MPTARRTGRFQTATLSFNRISEKLMTLLYRQNYCGWGWVVDIYDGFAICQIEMDGQEPALYRVEYTVDANDQVALSGEPKPVEQKYLYRGTLELAASNLLIGDAAADLLAELEEKNPLVAAIKGTPNSHLTVFDLTTVGKASQHLGSTKYLLAKKGLAAALPTLLTKPIHVTSGLDGHSEDDEEPTCIGVFIGADVIQNDDDTCIVRAVGTLWNRDYPDVIEAIQSKKSKLGASYEIEYFGEDTQKLAAGVLQIDKYSFAGGAILYKAAAAHPETQVHVARSRAGARPSQKAQGGTAMSKYAGVPAELELTVENIVSAAITQFKATSENATLIKERDDALASQVSMRAEMDEKKKKWEDDEKASKDAATKLQTENDELKAQLQTASTELKTAKDVIAEAELDKKLEADWTALAKEQGFDEKLKAAKMPILKKIAQGGAVTVVEATQLLAGGTKGVQMPGGAQQPVPLYAGNGEPSSGEPKDPKVVGQHFPNSIKAHSIR